MTTSDSFPGSAAGSTTDDDETQLVEQPASTSDLRPKKESEPIQVGSSIGRYVIIDEIGSGGMGVVIRAYDPRLHREVALKRLRPGSLDEDAETRLIREAQAMAQLSHPNVIAVYDVEKTDDGVVMAMEFVEGKTLRQWIKRRRPWRQVLELFIQAARGLEAAHKAGLVHRDFKPSNVLVGDDDRVRVMDFGLARVSSGRTDDSLAPREDFSTASWSDDSLSKPLTQVGMVMGTPVYMAPEQHVGASADAAADQYAFCVALWEGLCGARPFKGSTRELASAKRRGPPSWPKEHADVPRRIVEAIRKGLAVKPTERWSSMSELIAELERDPAKKIRNWAMSAGAASVLIAGGVGIGAWQSHRSSQCDSARAELDDVWDEDRRGAVERSIGESDPTYGPTSATTTTTLLTEYASQWKDMRQDACEATALRGEQSVEVLHLRMRCLDSAKAELATTLELLEDADPATALHAVDMSRELPALARCGDVESLMSQVRPPEDPELSKDVDAIGQQLARAVVSTRAGRVDEALTLVQPMLERATVLDYPPILADAHRALGLVRRAEGKLEDAATELEEAYRIALQHEHDEVATITVIDVSRVVGPRLGRHDEALVWGQSAVGLARQRDQGGILEARAQHVFGASLLGAGKTEEALEALRRAVELSDKVFGGEHPERVWLFLDLARAQAASELVAEAEQSFERAQTLGVSSYGEGHPRLREVTIARGLFELQRGRFDQARTLLERVDDPSPEASSVLSARRDSGLARALVETGGDRTRAQALAQRARAYFEREPKSFESDLAALEDVFPSAPPE